MLEVGTIVDKKYKILHKIGQGGMSNVYLAINERANKQWAIKEVRKDGVSDYQIVRQSLLAETEMLKSLSHPYLPSIVDVIDEEGRFLIVMDYIEGNTLLSAIREYGAQPQEYVIEWGMQLCNVFGYLHSQTPPIVYRDLKPSNIMLRPNGTIALIDFGTAREYKLSSIEDTTCLGTYGYAAPEQFGGMGQTDARTDIYTLGMTLYHLVTGHNPSEPPYDVRPIREWDPTLSQGLERIILKCTQKNPADRYRNCAEVLYDLEHYQELDISYRRRSMVKLMAFSAAALIGISCAITSLGFRAHASQLEKSNYTIALEEARGNALAYGSSQSYASAIFINPTDSAAYIDLLEQVYLIDNCFSREEDEQLRQLLITQYDSKTTFEQKLRENVAGYELFCYRLGLAYFYSYEGTGNKPLSSKWLSIAADSNRLESSQIYRAKLLGRIASYYEQLGRQDLAGDSYVRYSDYWKDLMETADGEISVKDNQVTAMIVYQELVYQIYEHAVDFKRDGVSQISLSDSLDTIEHYISDNHTRSGSTESERLVSLQKNVEELLILARRAIETAFSSQGG